MKRLCFLVLSIPFCMGCSKDKVEEEAPEETAPTFLSAVDLSSYPEIMEENPVFYYSDGSLGELPNIVKASGVNTGRLRLWVDPPLGHSGFDEVQAFAQNLRSKGFKIWLSLHYSDTWADPGQQQIPEQWAGLAPAALQERLYTYTQRVVTEIGADYIQIGNEINSGVLHPTGVFPANKDEFIELLQSGISAVRENAPETQIILHYAGIDRAEWFYDQLKELDYDIIGLSYYPIWHGKSLDEIQRTLEQLGATHNKQVLIAETAYPFTLAWNDWTDNIVGEEDQLLPGFPATPEGQGRYVSRIKSLVSHLDHGLGFCYWGGELIAWKGPEATDASPWENQALFNFENKALPALESFGAAESQ